MSALHDVAAPQICLRIAAQSGGSWTAARAKACAAFLFALLVKCKAWAEKPTGRRPWLVDGGGKCAGPSAFVFVLPSPRCMYVLLIAFVTQAAFRYQPSTSKPLLIHDVSSSYSSSCLLPRNATGRPTPRTATLLLPRAVLRAPSSRWISSQVVAIQGWPASQWTRPSSKPCGAGPPAARAGGKDFVRKRVGYKVLTAVMRRLENLLSFMSLPNSLQTVFVICGPCAARQDWQGCVLRRQVVSSRTSFAACPSRRFSPMPWHSSYI